MKEVQMSSVSQNCSFHIPELKVTFKNLPVENDSLFPSTGWGEICAPAQETHRRFQHLLWGVWLLTEGDRGGQREGEKRRAGAKLWVQKWLRIRSLTLSSRNFWNSERRFVFPWGNHFWIFPWTDEHSPLNAHQSGFHLAFTLASALHPPFAVRSPVWTVRGGQTHTVSFSLQPSPAATTPACNSTNTTWDSLIRVAHPSSQFQVTRETLPACPVCLSECLYMFLMLIQPHCTSSLMIRGYYTVHSFPVCPCVQKNTCLCWRACKYVRMYVCLYLCKLSGQNEGVLSGGNVMMEQRKSDTVYKL